MHLEAMRYIAVLVYCGIGLEIPSLFGLMISQFALCPDRIIREAMGVMWMIYSEGIYNKTGSNPSWMA